MVSTALSFLFPGLGHAAIGKYRRGAIMALPAFALGLTLALIAVFDRSALYQILSPNFLASLLILDFVALVYHLWVMADGYRLATRLQPTRPGTGKLLSRGAVILVFAGAVTIHVGVASIDLQAQQTLGCVMSPSGPCITDIQPGQSVPTFDYSEDDTPDTSTSAPVVADTPSPTPLDTGSLTPEDTTAYPIPPACTGDSSNWAGSKCTLYLLLIGGDAGHRQGRLRRGQAHQPADRHDDPPPGGSVDRPLGDVRDPAKPHERSSRQDRLERISSTISFPR